jgi:hypothetical protein
MRTGHSGPYPDERSVESGTNLIGPVVIPRIRPTVLIRLTGRHAGFFDNATYHWCVQSSMHPALTHSPRAYGLNLAAVILRGRVWSTGETKRDGCNYTTSFRSHLGQVRLRTPVHWVQAPIGRPTPAICGLHAQGTSTKDVVNA